MPFPERLLVLGADAGVLSFSARCRPDIFLIERKEKFRQNQLAWIHECLIADYTEPDNLLPLIAAAHATRPFAQVYSPTEAGLVSAARMNEFLGLPGTSVATAICLKNKAKMREVLRRNKLSPVRFASGASREDIRSFAAEIQGPIIIKPPDSSGSFAVFKLQYPLTETVLENLWNELQTLGLSEFLMEEFLEGREISVETFSFDGRHIILAFTDKLINDNFIEMGHTVPARIDSEVCDQVTALVVRFLDTVGLKDGPGHTEVMLTRKGPFIVESHNRTGGGNIPQLVEMAVGIQLFDLAFSWPFRAVPPLEQSPKISGAGAIRFFAASPGMVIRIQGVEEAGKIEGVDEIYFRVAPGEKVGPLRRSADRVGFITARGRTPAEAVARCQQAMSRVTIETGPDS